MAKFLSRAPVFAILLFSVISVVAADDDSDDDNNSATPPPSIPPAIVALVFFGISFLIHVIHTFRFGRPRPFMFALLIGMGMMIGGFATRILSADPATKHGNNVATIALTLLAPCLFLGLNYMILGRLAAALGPDVARTTMFIAPTRVAAIFVCSDVTTFLIQAVGGALLASSSVKTNILGTHLLLTGLVLQLVSFGLFIGLLAVFGHRLQQRFPHLWNASTGRPSGLNSLLSREFSGDWKLLYYTLWLTCVALLIRSIFRVAEFATGFNSYLSTHEAFTYSLDTLPIWVGMSMYCVVWPPKFLRPLGSTEAGESSVELRKNGDSA
ncbi:RTA1 like protein-domain-containing protein [Mycena filopes]|nr:RTA1 like protein-domain-containing protein [Mycena filopes]